MVLINSDLDHIAAAATTLQLMDVSAIYMYIYTVISLSICLPRVNPGWVGWVGGSVFRRGKLIIIGSSTVSCGRHSRQGIESAPCAVAKMLPRQ